MEISCRCYFEIIKTNLFYKVFNYLTLKDYIKDIVSAYTKNRPSLLLLDEFNTHKTADVLGAFEVNNIRSLLIPGGFTSMLQPLDVSVNKTIKAILKEEWRKWCEESEPIYTKAGNRQKPSYKVLLDMVYQIYKQLGPKDTLISKV